MYRHFTRILCNVAAALTLATSAVAEEISIPFGPIDLLGNFERAGDDTPGTVALITHGTLAHGGMEVIANLQAALADRGVASLAHNLSYGIDERRGMYHCAVDHTHRDEDADLEIAAWLDWLRGEAGAKQIALIGHSRGGRQVARAAANGAKVDAVILLAPATAGAETAAREGFEELYGAPWEPMVETARGMKPDASMDTPGFLFCPKAHVRASSILSYYGNDPVGAEDHAGKLKTRTLVIAAESDEIVTDVEESFADLDDGDRLTVEFVEGADHFFLNFYAEDAADLIVDFLNKQGEDFGIAWDEADIAYGEYLGGECVGCHTPDGAGGVPNIHGLDPAYLYSALRAYGSGIRDNPAMVSVSKALDAEQMIAVAAYFATFGED